MAKRERPSVLDNYMVSGKKPAAPVAEASRKTADASQSFRTSVYFHRAVHNKLRDIAHAERKSVADLIHEGLDDVLAKRNFPSTEELKAQT